MRRRCRSSHRRVLLAALSLLLGPACGAPPSQPAPAESGVVALPDGALAYDERGRGTVIVLIHGGFVDRRLWDGVVPVLARGYRVVRYDIRGFGESPPPRRPVAPAEDLRALLDSLGVDRAHLVGLSMGGGIALEFALAHPERVRSLVAVSAVPSGFEMPEEDARRVAELFEVGARHGADSAVARWLAHPMLAATMANPASAPRMRRLAGDNGRVFTLPVWPFLPPDRPALPRLRTSRVPTLVLVGERDTPANLAGARALADSLRDAELVVVPDAAHMIPLERPATFIRLLGRFLAAHGADPL